MQLDLNTHSTDPYYRSPVTRHWLAHLSRDHDLDTVIVPELEVPAVVDVWQRTMWVAPGLDQDALAILIRDGMVCSDFGLSQAAHFVRRASRQIRRLTSQNAVTLDL